MTPKEKAQELVNKYHLIDGDDTLMYYIGFETAKKCAIVAIDEINSAFDNAILQNPFKAYWDSVKQEIENL